MKQLFFFLLILLQSSVILSVTEEIDLSNYQDCSFPTIPAILFNTAKDTSLGEIIVCDNEPFVIEGEAYFETGSFEITIEGSESGCDSIISFSILNITPVAIIDGITEVICTNDEIELNATNSEVNIDAIITYQWEKNGFFYDNTEYISAGPGLFSLTVIATIGDVVCSHTTAFEVPISPTFTPVIEDVLDTLCWGDCTTLAIQSQDETYTYLWEDGATTIDIIVCPEITTTYSVSVTDNTGCEQIAKTMVNVNPLGIFDDLNAQICIGDTLDITDYIGYNITLSNPSLAVIDNNNLIGLNIGIIDISLSDQDGCLQPNTNLFVTIVECEPNCVSKDTSIFVELCLGDSIYGYGETGVYADTFMIGAMCDSIVLIDLAILSIFYDSIVVDLCFGGSYNGVDSTSIAIDTLQSFNGCDSIIYTSIFVDTLISDSVSVEICEGENYLGFTMDGDFVDTLMASSGCDSVLFINLSVIPIVNSEVSITICEGEEYAGYTEMGVYQNTIVSALGCDSTVTLDLEVIAIDKDTIDVTICDGLSFLGYSQEGQYIDTTFSPEGCTELRVLNLKLIDSIFITLDTLICPGDTLLGSMINEEGVYSFESSGEQGCSVTTFASVLFKDEGCSVGVDDLDKDWQVQVYPNPTQGVLDIESDSKVSIALFSTNGTHVLSRKYFSKKNQLDISSLREGIYILKLYSNNKQKIERIIKID